MKKHSYKYVCPSFNYRLLVLLIQIPYVKEYIECVRGYKRKYVYLPRLAEIQMIPKSQRNSAHLTSWQCRRV